MSQIPRDTSQGMGSVSNVPISGSTAQRDHNPSKVHAFKDEVVGGIKKTIGKVVRSDKMVQEGMWLLMLRFHMFFILTSAF